MHFSVADIRIWNGWEQPRWCFSYFFFLYV